MYIGSGKVSSLFLSDQTVHNIELKKDEVIIILEKVDMKKYCTHYTHTHWKWDPSHRGN